jgi:hypothetical protein
LCEFGIDAPSFRVCTDAHVCESPTLVITKAFG